MKWRIGVLRVLRDPGLRGLVQVILAGVVLAGLPDVQACALAARRLFGW